MEQKYEDKVSALLEENGYDVEEESYEIFRNPDYFNSIIGVTEDNRIVYDYDKMAKELMSEDNISEEESVAFISYNNVRALDYNPSDKKPIIMYPLYRSSVKFNIPFVTDEKGNKVEQMFAVKTSEQSQPSTNCSVCDECKKNSINDYMEKFKDPNEAFNKMVEEQCDSCALKECLDKEED